jgi:prolyl-tRNA synthetase
LAGRDRSAREFRPGGATAACDPAERRSDTLFAAIAPLNRGAAGAGRRSPSARPRDLAAGTALMTTRLGGQKTPVSLEEAPARLDLELTTFQHLLLRRARQFRDQRTITVDTWGEFTQAVAAGWARAFACGQTECEDDIKAATGATPRVIPADGEPEEGTCIRCGRPSAYGKRLIFGRAY